MQFGVRIFLVAIFTAVVVPWFVQAQTLRVGIPQIAGSGCPNGSVTAIVSPDQSALSVLFDQFVLEANRGSHRDQRKSCSFSIPIDLSPGYNVEANSIDYRGYAAVPKNANAYLRTEGPILRPGRFPIKQTETQFKGTFANEFFVRQAVLQSFKGKCEYQREIAFTSHLDIAPRNTRGIRQGLSDDAVISVDSLEVGGPSQNGAITINFAIRPCR